MQQDQIVTIRRDGSAVVFDQNRIANAMAKAFTKVNGPTCLATQAVRDSIAALTEQVVLAVTRRGNISVHIEDIQDQVELALMRSGEYAVAREYITYRAKRNEERELHEFEAQAARAAMGENVIHVTKADGTRVELDGTALLRRIKAACDGLVSVDALEVVKKVMHDLYDGVSAAEVERAILLGARVMIEQDPDYSLVTARLLLNSLVTEVTGKETALGDMQSVYEESFAACIQAGIESELLSPELGKFDLPKLAKALKAERDLQFNYLGLQTLYDRYFLHVDGKRIEMPQGFFMRVAMGLALNEKNREERAIEFYNLISSFDFMCSTPTLFNSGTRRPQLSSCYLTTISDDLEGIYGGITENALLSKYAGGLGNDWTNVRALNSHIKGTNGKSQGVVPFLKVVNDTAVAVNQGGKRKGAVCAYLETWHLDIEEFLELRKNTGDDRRRTHDMNTSNWIPDLFMKRVMEGADWTLFTPSECPDLHDKYGKDFEAAYVDYEAKAERGEIKLFKKVPAQGLWRKMLTMLFETGHPWLTFKDPCNVRSPQQHVGVVHSSNLCTEITLNTSDDEIAVCNLGSVNLAAHIGVDGKLDHAKLQRTVRTAMRMLDNVVDVNYYPVEKARNANMRHRPVGMGIMGFQDALQKLRVPYASQEAVEFADRSMESVCYYAYWASSELAEERGVYSSFEGSLWSQGVLPHETIAMLKDARGGFVEVDSSVAMDWEALRARIKLHGMRNSNCVAIAPTATISNIVGVSQSIEPTYQNLFVKSNLSGEFTIVNAQLVADLKKLGLWDSVMIADLKHFDGSLSKIDRIPADLRELYATAFEIEPTWLIEAASRRQKWIDQAQSLNIYMAGVSGRKLDETYKLAWLRGLKTTYYLRTMGATSAEKSTSRAGALNAVQATDEPKFCSIDNPDCEACQ